MGKTRAEIQRAYRERKKQELGEEYLSKEKERVKRYKVPTDLLSARQLEQRRKKGREWTRKYRENQKKKALLTAQGKEPEHTGRTRSKTALSESPIIVSLQFNRLKSANTAFRNEVNTRKRVSRRAAKAYKEIKRLNEENEKLRLSNEKYRKKIYRDKRTPSTTSSSSERIVEASTPRSSVESAMRSEGISPRQAPQLRKKLIMQNAVISELKAAASVIKGKERKSLHHIVSGGIIKKYRAYSRVSKEIGLGRNQLRIANTSKSPVAIVNKSRAAILREQLRKDVLKFLERGDNSATLPGKRDAKKDGKKVKQKHILNDYLANLHEKFLAENPHLKLSYSSFCRLRPSNFSTIKYSERKTCLCERHQNMALKLRSLKSMKVVTTSNPDAFIRTHDQQTLDDLCQNITAKKVTFKQWKRVNVIENEKTKKKIKLIEIEEDRVTFISNFKTELNLFKEHAERVKQQYQQLRKLKLQLPKGHLIAQMDFAENYSCVSLEEVQSAYWDQGEQVTLHPVVFYFRNEEGELAHKSSVIISDTLSHTASTIFAFLKKSIIPEARELVPEAEFIHYWTDSPTSQYRNKKIFNIVSRHKQLFNINASWNYFEAGHGKGPCDGVGGSTKRGADEASRRDENLHIQSAIQFYNWASTKESATRFSFVSDQQCKVAEKELDMENLQRIPGTMKLHAVVIDARGDFWSRGTSCFCSSCFNENQFSPSCNGWIKHMLKGSPPAAEKSKVPEPAQHQEEIDSSCADDAQDEAAEEARVIPDVYDFVAAVYCEDNQWYVGKVIEVDDEEDEAYISFMTADKERNPPTYSWPSREDKVWIKFKDVLCKINPPAPTGKSKRCFKLDCNTESLIKDIYAQTVGF